MFNHRKRGVLGEFERHLNHRKEQKEMKKEPTFDIQKETKGLDKAIKNSVLIALGVALATFVVFILPTVLLGAKGMIVSFIFGVLLLVGFIAFVFAMDYFEFNERKKENK